ncbi:MAG: AbrB/MazE/SpoVT family DNA-binding domain-containing protein [Acetobacteraceae bacterium]|jgi:putative addiction module antidote
MEAAIVELKLIPVGDDVGVVLPPELLESLGIREGDTLDAIMTPDGLLLTAGDAAFQRQMAIARRIMQERRGVLRRLAES